MGRSIGIRELGEINLPENILSVYGRSSRSDLEAGMAWYQDAKEFCETLAAGVEHDVITCAGVVSAVSPRTPWGRNKSIARELITRYGRKEPYTGLTINTNAELAYRIMDGVDPYTVLSNKRLAFWRNIVGDLSYVTIDAHAARLACLIEQCTGPAPSAYHIFAEAYTTVAEAVGIYPAQLQAVCWVTWRRMSIGVNTLAWLDSGSARSIREAV